MKKVVLFFALLLGALTLQSFNPINFHQLDFSVGIIKIKPGGTTMPRTPICPPTVGLDGHTLYFETDHPSFTLVLLDEEGEEVYSAVAPSDVDSVTLPSTLTGDYELQLYNGSNYYFYCEITF